VRPVVATDPAHSRTRVEMSHKNIRDRSRWLDARRSQLSDGANPTPGQPPQHKVGNLTSATIDRERMAAIGKPLQVGHGRRVAIELVIGTGNDLGPCGLSERRSEAAERNRDSGCQSRWVTGDSSCRRLSETAAVTARGSSMPGKAASTPPTDVILPPGLPPTDSRLYRVLQASHHRARLG
jgi:hypothetical protein